MPTTDQINAISNLGSSTIALIMMGVALYFITRVLGKISDAFEKVAESMNVYAQNQAKQGEVLQIVAEGVKEIVTSLKDEHICPYYNKTNDKSAN